MNPGRPKCGLVWACELSLSGWQAKPDMKTFRWEFWRVSDIAAQMELEKSPGYRSHSSGRAYSSAKLTEKNSSTWREIAEGWLGKMVDGKQTAMFAYTTYSGRDYGGMPPSWGIDWGHPVILPFKFSPIDENLGMWRPQLVLQGAADTLKNTMKISDRSMVEHETTLAVEYAAFMLGLSMDMTGNTATPAARKAIDWENMSHHEGNQNWNGSELNKHTHLLDTVDKAKFGKLLAKTGIPFHVLFQDNTNKYGTGVYAVGTPRGSREGREVSLRQTFANICERYGLSPEERHKAAIGIVEALMESQVGDRKPYYNSNAGVLTRKFVKNLGANVSLEEIAHLRARDVLAEVGARPGMRFWCSPRSDSARALIKHLEKLGLNYVKEPSECEIYVATESPGTVQQIQAAKKQARISIEDLRL